MSKLHEINKEVRHYNQDLYENNLYDLLKSITNNDIMPIIDIEEGIIGYELKDQGITAQLNQLAALQSAVRDFLNSSKPLYPSPPVQRREKELQEALDKSEGKK